MILQHVTQQHYLMVHALYQYDKFTFGHMQDQLQLHPVTTVCQCKDYTYDDNRAHPNKPDNN